MGWTGATVCWWKWCWLHQFYSIAKWYRPGYVTGYIWCRFTSEYYRRWKMADYFGKYLVENYNLTDYRNDSEYASIWDKKKLHMILWNNNNMMNWTNMVNWRALVQMRFKIRRKNDEENYFNNVMYYAFSIYDDSMWK